MYSIVLILLVQAIYKGFCTRLISPPKPRPPTGKKAFHEASLALVRPKSALSSKNGASDSNDWVHLIECVWRLRESLTVSTIAVNIHEKVDPLLHTSTQGTNQYTTAKSLM